MRDFSDELGALQKRIDEARTYLRIGEQRTRLAELEAQASRPDLWDDPDAARRVTTELSAVRDDIELVDGLEARVEDAQTLYQLGREESDDSVEPEIDAAIDALRSELDRLELRALFTGEYDERDADLPGELGRGWHRRAGLDRDAPAHVHPLGRAARLHGGARRGERGHRGRAELGHVHGAADVGPTAC